MGEFSGGGVISNVWDGVILVVLFGENRMKPIYAVPFVGGNHAQHRKSGFTLVELLVVIAIIGVLVGLLLPAVQQARESARRSRCVSNLKQIGLSVLNYHDARDQFPPGNTGTTDWQCGPGGNGPALGFLVMVLPYIEEQSLYDKFDLNASVQSTKNMTAAQSVDGGKSPPSQFRCPSYGGQAFGGVGYGCSGGGGNVGATCYAGVQCSTDSSWYGGTPAEAGVFYLRDLGTGSLWWYPQKSARITRVKDVLDGTSNTLLCGEVRPDALKVLYPNQPIDWIGLYCAWTLGTASRAGTIRFNQYGPNQIRSIGYGDWRDAHGLPFSSTHAGGVFMAMVDGSVRFVSDTVDITLWRNVANIAGGERTKLK